MASVQIPSNISYYIKCFEPKMTGKNPKALNAIKSSVKKFNQDRSKDLNLRNIQLTVIENGKGIANEQLYLVELKGRNVKINNTYYQARVIKFFLFFLDTYPVEPPQIIAGHIFDPHTQQEKRFLHINVAEMGHFCMLSNQKEQQYYDYTTLKDILTELQHTLYNPNATSAYNSELFSAYKPEENYLNYYTLLNSQAKLLEKVDDSDSESMSEGSES